MYASNIVVVLTLAVVTGANVLQPRVTNIIPDLSKTCSQKVVSVWNALPTPDSKELIEAAFYDTAPNPCQVTAPASLSSQYSSWTSQLSSWSSVHSKSISSLIEECPKIGNEGDLIGICATGAKAVAPSTTTGGSSATSTSKSTSNGVAKGTAAASTTSKAAGARETGRVVGAVAVAALAFAL